MLTEANVLTSLFTDTMYTEANCFTSPYSLWVNKQKLNPLISFPQIDLTRCDPFASGAAYVSES